MPCTAPQPHFRRFRADGLALGPIPGELLPEQDEGPDVPDGMTAEAHSARTRARALELLREQMEPCHVAERFGLTIKQVYRMASNAGVPILPAQGMGRRLSRWREAPSTVELQARE